MMQRFVVFHPGTQHSWQTALALQELGLLEFYATSIFYKPEEWPYRVEKYLPARMRARVHEEFRRFSHPLLDPARVRTAGAAEWLERVAHRAGYRGLAKRIDRYGNERFGRSLEAAVLSRAPFALWGYDGVSRDLFRVARAAGRICILDRTNGDWRALNATMDQLYAAYPDFVADADYRVPQAIIDRSEEEYSLADVILAGSPFAADTIRAHATDRAAGERLRVLPYCYDEHFFEAQPAPQPRPPNEPLRFLFVGQAGVRKGIHLVLKAFERIPASAATLTIVGDLQVPQATFARYADRVAFSSTVARADIPAVMADHDVLLFPTYFEGFGIVLLEALASGLAIIQSANAGLVVTPDTGILLSELGEQALYEAVMSAIERRDVVESWRANALVEAKRYSFAAYRDNIAALVRDLDSAGGPG